MKTLLVMKKSEFDQSSRNLEREIVSNLGISQIENLRIGNYYFIKDVEEGVFQNAVSTVFTSPVTDEVFLNEIPSNIAAHKFAVGYLPAQYDQQSDSAEECIKLMMKGGNPAVISSKLIFFDGNVSQEDIKRIKDYYINKVDSFELNLSKPPVFGMPELVGDGLPEIQSGFIGLDSKGLEVYLERNSMAMTLNDLTFTQKYFRDEEKRDPSYTEIKIIDTYWSDHCRHTTFSTKLKDIIIEDGALSAAVEDAYKGYKESREYVYGDKAKDRSMCLMDLATIGMKELRKRGYLDNLDISEEINACGIHIDVNIDGKQEPYILLFKNETHNHPTEIEPFGGAATCLGGAIRDPLSGRGYVFGAMRVTGSGDPTVPVSETLAGKLPQAKITTTAAKGYSSYGNQIGTTTGKVKEFYHPGFVAKRMECGAVLASVPLENVRREQPLKGDVIVLVGGKTGKDGIGGATGSSTFQTEESMAVSGSEVQKGNPTEERKIVRFMRKKEVSLLIKRCNDFGAGGVAVAIGELCDGLDINLNKVPLKYSGMTATDITISESQERMAMVVEAKDYDEFVRLADEENLDAIKVADVTDLNRLRIYYNDTVVADISRDFLNTNGVTAETSAVITAPTKEKYFVYNESSDSLEDIFKFTMSQLNNCSNIGLAQQFDSSAGGNVVLAPLGGKYQLTENDAIVMTIPLEEGETDTTAYMSYGYDPYLMEHSPFLGAQYAVVESLARLVSTGADYTKARMSFQEFFPRLGNDSKRWGQPLGALLGALVAQKELNCGSVGGKDSMSGSFEDLDVPPTLVSFAVANGSAKLVISQEIKPDKGGNLYLLSHSRKENETPNYNTLHKIFRGVQNLNIQGKIHAAMSVGAGGLVKAISNMCYGNKAGLELSSGISLTNLLNESYGSILIQSDKAPTIDGVDIAEIGKIVPQFEITWQGQSVDLSAVLKADQGIMESLFPTTLGAKRTVKPAPEIKVADKEYKADVKVENPQVLIPVLPGTNGEWDLAKQFKKAGATVNFFVFKNRTAEEIKSSFAGLAAAIEKADILALPGGINLGDEPDGSAKYITTVFRNPVVQNAIERFVSDESKLMLGLGNGFQALVKLGLLPYGTYTEAFESSLTTARNKIDRHVARYANIKFISNKSPWLKYIDTEEIYSVPVSCGDGRIVINKEQYEILAKNGQVSALHVGDEGEFDLSPVEEQTGCSFGVEGLLSPNGRIFGKMGYSDRVGKYAGVNIPNNKNEKIFGAAVDFFR